MAAQVRTLMKFSFICHVLNKKRTGFELGPQSIYGLLDGQRCLLPAFCHIVYEPAVHPINP